MEPIKTECGLVSGTTGGDKGQKVNIYRGIPYAAPPVGELRWKPPQPVTPWEGTRACIDFSEVTPQVIGMGPKISLPQNEDCLYLNVITPAKKASDKLPVMVFMHGGGFSGGHGNESLSNSPRLARHGVVLVTVNMRLEALGLLAHRLLSRESPRLVSGNYMFLDMIGSLKWVQKNIEAFGGDPGNVTIFGESGGGAKVAVLMATPMARGLFHRAILESAWNPPAGAMTGASLKDMEAIGEKLFAKLGVDKEADPVAAARALPAQKILETNRELGLEEKAMMGIWDETVDGWLLPENPVNILKSGKYNFVPFIAGGNLGELTNGRFVLPHMIPLYLEMFSGAAKANVKAYAYIFNRVPEGQKKAGTTAAPHGMELYYVFGDYDNTSGWWTMPMPGQPDVQMPDPELNKTDRKVSEAMMTMWARFAKTGNPNAKKKADWPAYEAAADQYLYITESQEVQTGFSKIKKR